MKVPETELINEFECQYYGFSPCGFTDSVYNISLQSWEDAVKEASSTLLFSKKVLNKKKYLADLTGRFFHSKAIKHAFDAFTERVLKYILRIPRHVTLPEHENTYQLLLSNDPSTVGVDELNRRNDKLEKLIVEYRFTLKEVGEQIEEANDTIDVLTTLIKQLKRISSDVGEDSLNDTDVNTPSIVTSTFENTSNF